MNKILVCISAITLSLVSCIENDIPFPIEELKILSMEVEGQSNADGSNKEDAVINNKERTVTLFVDDKVDLSRLTVKQFTVTEGAEVSVDGFPEFPVNGFASVEDLPGGVEPIVMDFTNPITFKLNKYQEYVWEVSVKQVIKRSVQLEGQIGDPIIDVERRRVIVYVDQNQPLNAITVRSMSLGGQSGSLKPNPMTVTDFSAPVEFFVKEYWSSSWEKWMVYVYNAVDEKPIQTNVFPMSTSAIINGKMDHGDTPTLQYRLVGNTEWTPETEVRLSGTSFEATIRHLLPVSNYEYQVSLKGKVQASGSFTTVHAESLENGDFEKWHLEKDKIWNPWNANEDSFWDTGNDGAAVVGKSNSIPTSDDTCNGKGKAALLETKNMMGFLAAGNIFTGQYVRTEIPNGVLSFGRKFSSFPTKLRINYKYTSRPVTHVKEPFMDLKGEPDSCYIYIALTHWDKPREIRTDPKKRQLFDKNDPQVIAYAEYFQGTSSTEWETKDLVLDYRKQVVPTHILVVATASKYGDYFTGGEGSRLLIDNFELIYE